MLSLRVACLIPFSLRGFLPGKRISYRAPGRPVKRQKSNRSGPSSVSSDLPFPWWPLWATKGLGRSRASSHRGGPAASQPRGNRGELSPAPQVMRRGHAPPGPPRSGHHGRGAPLAPLDRDARTRARGSGSRRQDPCAPSRAVPHFVREDHVHEGEKGSWARARGSRVGGSSTANVSRVSVLPAALRRRATATAPSGHRPAGSGAAK